jgi:hypothetical protein
VSLTAAICYGDGPSAEAKSGSHQPKQRERCEFDYCVAQEGNRIPFLYQVQAMVWYSGDQAIAEWKVEQEDLRDLGKRSAGKHFHGLSTDFFKVPLASGVASSGSSFGNGRR